MIDEYEKKHYLIEAHDPIEAIKIRMVASLNELFLPKKNQ
jgi:antitoxin component HigA of HigAB toxin-antitoxin module